MLFSIFLQNLNNNETMYTMYTSILYRTIIFNIHFLYDKNGKRKYSNFLLKL